MPINSRVKGARYERKIVNIFRQTLNLTKEQCYRTPLSGGHYAESSADIQFSDDVRRRLNLSIECKHHSGVSLSQLLRVPYPSSPWPEWCDQAVKAANRRGEEPVVIARVDRQDYIVMGWTPWIKEIVPLISFARDISREWYLFPLAMALPRFKEQLDGMY